jgi:hypothetical protein
MKHLTQEERRQIDKQEARDVWVKSALRKLNDPDSTFTRKQVRRFSLIDLRTRFQTLSLETTRLEVELDYCISVIKRARASTLRPGKSAFLQEMHVRMVQRELPLLQQRMTKCVEQLRLISEEAEETHNQHIETV